MDPKVTVLLVDDDANFRGAVRELLKVDPRVTVLGEAADGAMAVRLAAELSPDVVLMDINMPEMNGIEATRQIRSLPNAPRVIGASSPVAGSADSIVEAGAECFISKTELFKHLLPTIHRFAAPDNE